MYKYMYTFYQCPYLQRHTLSNIGVIFGLCAAMLWRLRSSLERQVSNFVFRSLLLVFLSPLFICSDLTIALIPKHHQPRKKSIESAVACTAYGIQVYGSCNPFFNKTWSLNFGAGIYTPTGQIMNGVFNSHLHSLAVKYSDGGIIWTWTHRTWENTKVTSQMTAGCTSTRQRKSTNRRWGTSSQINVPWHRLR